jgi:GT2 family glycosyltransferase
VSGWILDLEDSERKHEAEVFVGGKRVGSARADRFDPLVQSHHGGDGYYAFAIYYNGELSGPVEAAALDKESGTPLRSKQPLVTRSVRSGSPLTIEKLRIGTTVELVGRVGAYPWGNDVSLELWSGEQRVVSGVNVVGVNEAEGLFSAKLEGQALRHLLNGGVELAFPGLKEAGLAIPVPRPPVTAVIAPMQGKLRLNLKGDFEQNGPIPLTLRLRNNGIFTDQEINLTSRVTRIATPPGLRLEEEAIEVLLGGVTLPTRIEWPLLDDPQFRQAGEQSSAWAISANANIEQGFFAFPVSFADEHQLSGYTALLLRTSAGGPLLLRQRIRDVPPSGQKVSVAAFVRAAKRSKVVARLRDDEGVIGEAANTSKSDARWFLLRVECKEHRQIVGDLVFEMEASGRNVDQLEVALGNSWQPHEERGERFGSNLLVNAGFHDWPNGVGIMEHSLRGEPCRGWRIFNRRTVSRVLSRAVMDPADGTLGMAVAAPQVSHYLRLEADFSSNEITDRPLVLRFRAGAPPAARQLLADAADAVPQFAIIGRAYIIRRTRVTTADSFKESDEMAATFARKVPVGYGIETFSYAIPPIEETDPPEPQPGERIDISYHLTFDFRHATVIALFDVEVLADAVEERAEETALKVEDRNIEMQIEMLQAVAHWRGPTPVRLATSKRERRAARLKWGAGKWCEPVTIVIPVFNALPETLACLESLNGSTTVPLLVRVIDDASDEPAREALKHYAQDKPWVDVHSFARNRGYTFASDYGVREARTSWVVLLNSDTVLTRGWLENMLACAHSDPSIAFVGPLSNAASYQSVPELYDASKKWKINRLPPGMTPQDMADIVRRVSVRDYPEVPILNGFCTLMKRSAFIELGGLNSTAFPAGYGEENDLCFRAGKAGLKLAVADDVYVYHVKSASFGSSRRQELTKAGNAALAKLHPDVDIGALTARFRETPALVAIRKAVAAELARVPAPAPDDEGFPETESGLSAVDSNLELHLQKA